MPVIAARSFCRVYSSSIAPCMRFFRLVRMNLGKAGETGNIFVDLRIVFHRTGAEWIEAIVDTEVAAGQRGIVANDINFIHFGQLAGSRRRIDLSESVSNDRLPEHRKREANRLRVQAGSIQK